MRHFAVALIGFFLLGADCAAAASLYVPAVARGAGLAGSLWRTELVLRNPGSESIELELVFLQRGVDNSGRSPQRVDLAAGETLAFEDLLLEVFDLESAGGALAITSPRDFQAEATIVNEGSGGRFGQGFRALGERQVLAAEGRSAGVVLGLREDAETRSNLYALNVSDSRTTAKLSISETFGGIVEIEIELPPLAAYLRSLDELAPTLSGGLTVSVRVIEGEMLLGGSSIDRGTGDPTTHELIEPLPSFTGRWTGRLGEPFVDTLGGIELEIDGAQRLRSVDLSYGAPLESCGVRFPLGRDDLDASLDELAAGLELINGFSCFGCGDIIWTLEVELDGELGGHGRISAFAEGFSGDFAGCSGELGELEIQLGRRP